MKREATITSAREDTARTVADDVPKAGNDSWNRPDHEDDTLAAIVRPSPALHAVFWCTRAAEPVTEQEAITLYDSDGFQVGNSLNRFAVAGWMPFKFNTDCSLDIFFQNESPGKDKETNWLPAPKGPFNLTMRLYGPKSEALTGKWSPPPIKKAREPPSLTAQ